MANRCRNQSVWWRGTVGQPKYIVLNTLLEWFKKESVNKTVNVNDGLMFVSHTYWEHKRLSRLVQIRLAILKFILPKDVTDRCRGHDWNRNLLVAGQKSLPTAPTSHRYQLSIKKIAVYWRIREWNEKVSLKKPLLLSANKFRSTLKQSLETYQVWKIWEDNRLVRKRLIVNDVPVEDI